MMHVAVRRLCKGRGRRRRRRQREPHRTSHAHLPAFENVINTNWNSGLPIPPPLSLSSCETSVDLSFNITF